MHEAQVLVDTVDVKSDDLNAMLRRLNAFPDGIATSFKHLNVFLTEANLKVVTYLLAAQNLGIAGLRYDVGDSNGFVLSYSPAKARTLAKSGRSQPESGAR